MRKFWVLMLSVALVLSMGLATGCKKKEMTEEKVGESATEMKEKAEGEMKEGEMKEEMKEGAGEMQKEMGEAGQEAAPAEKKAGGY